MEYLKKTILLTNSAKQMSKLDITRSGSGFFASFKGYCSLPDDCKLGVVCKDKVLVKNLSCNKAGIFEFIIDRNFELSDKIGCVLMCKDKPIMWGANGEPLRYKQTIIDYINSTMYDDRGSNVSNYSYKNMPNDFGVCYSDINGDKAQQETNVESVTNNNYGDKKEEFPIECEAKNVDSAEGKEKCEEVTQQDTKVDNSTIESKDIDLYRKAILLHVAKNTQEKERVQSEKEVDELGNNTCICGVRETDEDSVQLFDVTDEEIETSIDNGIVGEEGNFYDMIKDQIDALFAEYPKEDKLSTVVPNSTWVKVDYENNGNVYVIGLVYEMEVLKYVAYGLPGKFRDKVPESIAGYSQWIPLDPNEPEEDGYNVMFQDANTGKTIKSE